MLLCSYYRKQSFDPECAERDKKKETYSHLFLLIIISSLIVQPPQTRPHELFICAKCHLSDPLSEDRWRSALHWSQHTHTHTQPMWGGRRCSLWQLISGNGWTHISISSQNLPTMNQPIICPIIFNTFSSQDSRCTIINIMKNNIYFYIVIFTNKITCLKYCFLGKKTFKKYF